MQSLNYWVLTIDSDFCTIGDLIQTGHGWIFSRDCDVGAPRSGDCCLIFDIKDQKFKKIGVFQRGVDKQPQYNGQVRLDFDIRVSNKKTLPISLLCLRRKWKKTTSQIQMPIPKPDKFIPMTRCQFDTALELWWGVTNFTDSVNNDFSLQKLPKDAT